MQLLHDFADLRQVLQLKKVPHYSTLCYAEKRLGKKERLIDSLMPLFAMPSPYIC